LGPPGSSAFRYDARPKGDAIDPLEALRSDLFDVPDVRGVLKFAQNAANGNFSIPFSATRFSKSPTRFNNALHQTLNDSTRGLHADVCSSTNYHSAYTQILSDR
jgi:hypothetical protein